MVEDKHFSIDEAYKIQSVIDMFSKFYPFKINDKNLETLIMQGGMGVAFSAPDLALEVGKCGGAGTIAMTGARYDEDILRALPLDKLIIGLNNLLSATDYETNYALGKEIGFDYIASGAGVTKEFLARIKNQLTLNKQEKHFITLPLHSSISGNQGHLKRNAGFTILENIDAGGHNGEGLDFNGTLELFKTETSNTEIIGDNKIIFAGGVRNPSDMVKVLDAGFHAIQLGTLLLYADEANINDQYRTLLQNAKFSDVGKVVSPAGLPGNGFWNEGVMQDALQGIPSKKYGCETIITAGCLKNCNGIEYSRQAAGYENAGDYCIIRALKAAQRVNDLKRLPGQENYKPLFFSGLFPEKSFNKSIIPTRMIIGKFLAGVYDSIQNGEGLIERKDFLKQRFERYNHLVPDRLDAMIFKNYR